MTAPLSYLAPDRRNIRLPTAAAAAFDVASADFDNLLSRLDAVRTMRFGFDPKAPRNWAEVGSLCEVNQRLASALAFITGTEA